MVSDKCEKCYNLRQKEAKRPCKYRDKGRIQMKFESWERIHTYCMNKPCAYESRPFGKNPICYRVAGKIFAQLSTKEEWFTITLKAQPVASDFYRRVYPGIVVRGYHCPPVQQPYWNTIDLNQFDEAVLWQMIDEAYEEVVKKLTKKDKSRLPVIAQYQFGKTNGTDPDFIKLCKQLDNTLDEYVGGTTQRKQYDQYNGLEDIHDVIMIYDGKTAVGCGGYKAFDEETAELKRVFMDKAYRGKGLSKELLRRIEADARMAGYRYMVLETGAILKEAVALYAKSGYKIINNYGPYVDMPQSICMQKKL